MPEESRSSTHTPYAYLPSAVSQSNWRRGHLEWGGLRRGEAGMDMGWGRGRGWGGGGGQDGLASHAIWNGAVWGGMVLTQGKSGAARAGRDGKGSYRTAPKADMRVRRVDGWRRRSSPSCHGCSRHPTPLPKSAPRPGSTLPTKQKGRVMSASSEQKGDIWATDEELLDCMRAH